MTVYISITNWYVITVLKVFKIDLDISHLLINSVSPEDIAVMCVNLVILFHTLGESNAILVRLFQIVLTPFLNQQDNTFLILNKMRHPPIKLGGSYQPKLDFG